MKFISLIVFAVALSYTWCLSRQSQPVAESVHMGIQDDMKNIIKNYIEKHVEGSHDIHFEQMWTETVDASKKVKAHFVYSFLDPQNTKIQLDGEALLNKISESNEEVRYSFDELKIQNQSIVFDEPMNIVAGRGDGADDEGTPAENGQEAPAENAHDQK
jgi:hypothetical protein